MPFADYLAGVNALLNFCSLTFLVLGRSAIKRGERDRHRKLMLTALACSVTFLVSYVIRMLLSGVHRFPEVGGIKTAYLALLGSHTILAASLVVLVPYTVVHGLKKNFAKHRRVARWTWPIWVYVSSTGVLVYIMLYHVAPRL